MEAKYTTPNWWGKSNRKSLKTLGASREKDGSLPFYRGISELTPDMPGPGGFREVVA
jgi:hypothetical protein